MVGDNPTIFLNIAFYCGGKLVTVEAYASMTLKGSRQELSTTRQTLLLNLKFCSFNTVSK